MVLGFIIIKSANNYISVKKKKISFSYVKRLETKAVTWSL